MGITDISPRVDGGSYPVKAVAGRTIEVSARVFREGHDAVGANVAFYPENSNPASAPFIRMDAAMDGLDTHTATVRPDSVGWWTLLIQAWSDPLTTWHHAMKAKLAAGQDAAELDNDLRTGVRLLTAIAARPQQAHAHEIAAAAAALDNRSLPLAERVAPALPLTATLAAQPIRELITDAEPIRVWVDRVAAEYSSWYEFFPRSAGAIVAPDGTPERHGTFADAAAELPRIAAMGFDVVYFPPIHPIGDINRKGRNNTVTCLPDDVGSPWAIGSVLGGHDAIHPELGTLADFDTLVATAHQLGIEIALDLALQCAPDHPWVISHPEWFTTRPDGTIAYAENPPKKYQDIYPLNFDNDPAGLYAEVLRVVRFWISHQVKIFRVDNPHTKPLNFWQWLINEVHRTDPEVVFLAEAFTRPAMMRELARIGFSQSYTYFTWRTAKDELIDYNVELQLGSDAMRPNFFVNTPDINPFHLQSGNPRMFALRAVLAATLSPSWGMYSGYELCEHEVLQAGGEEYLNSEKFQLRARDFATAAEQGWSLEPLISVLNRIRRAHTSLQRLKGLWFHEISNENLLCYSRRDPDTGDTMLMVVSLVPDGQQWGEVHLHVPALGMEPGRRFTVVDELTGESFDWGECNPVHIDTAMRMAHLFRVSGS